MAVKMAIWSRRPASAAANPVVLIDELGGYVCRRGAGGEVQRANFDTGHVRAVLDEDHDLLLLHVHGEGSHANLRDIVLCGVTFKAEQTDNGPITSGCRSGSAREPRMCKRVHSDSIEIRGFEQLRAAEVLLLSCNGFSVSGELYPSATSCLLSMIDGYAAAAVCNDRAVPLSTASVYLTHTIAALGGSIADAAAILNAEATFQSNSAPWFVVGRPLPGVLKWEDIETDGRFTAEGGLALLLLPDVIQRATPVQSRGLSWEGRISAAGIGSGSVQF